MALPVWEGCILALAICGLEAIAYKVSAWRRRRHIWAWWRGRFWWRRRWQAEDAKVAWQVDGRLKRVWCGGEEECSYVTCGGVRDTMLMYDGDVWYCDESALLGDGCTE